MSPTYSHLSSLAESVTKSASAIPKEDFAGLGIIACSSLSNMPIFPLSRNTSIESKTPLSEIIRTVGRKSDRRHDGFIIVDASLRPIMCNVQFVPPFSKNVDFDFTQNFGTRYVTALLSSKVAGVLFSLVLSGSYGLKIFANGEVVHQ
ncbi:hypothetical protein [Pseudovibrio sp. Ad26]|uniref:hypothetical protein n=1 Tax=Pseudovibrio sp. Ad26 TaxID=989410 RepID=UPI0007B19594|nr:hypothetical protein [Pseudovibrio sp. Ad26]KZL15842.1 hypothetical protein PsAD26_00910 [Pseudovibrio sp. Ad26]